ncbi:Oidioi.mRNA.OKI2018_I69.chr2.g3992.t1.cds [Oikopleura dioica]|uniref:Oidioi.mRNA.OKI2018_I69.chr2.g3992.t1.cds n=1 Tax=Oikopleura dioica TaxID=34765 RepID=A0ABN7SVS5_OIKDI|nr:Oidioi.mRNA.OKI2018_I69.chr2.g3992.t1.cds [Oikopleura dioica]
MFIVEETIQHQRQHIYHRKDTYQANTELHRQIYVTICNDVLSDLFSIYRLRVSIRSIGEAQILEITENSLPENWISQENNDETKPYTPITPAPTTLTTSTSTEDSLRNPSAWRPSPLVVTSCRYTSCNGQNEVCGKVEENGFYVFKCICKDDFRRDDKEKGLIFIN